MFFRTGSWLNTRGSSALDPIQIHPFMEPSRAKIIVTVYYYLQQTRPLDSFQQLKGEAQTKEPLL
jgi:hypothetical protein